MICGLSRWRIDRRALVIVPAVRHRRVDKRSAVHQRRRGIRWTIVARTIAEQGQVAALAARLVEQEQIDNARELQAALATGRQDLVKTVGLRQADWGRRNGCSFLPLKLALQRRPTRQ